MIPNGTGAESPNPLEHATPDAELAAAQLALGRPESAEVPDEQQLEAFEEQDAGRGEGSQTAAPAGRREPRQPLLTRFAGFLRGSWRELQRVQWPDRRQVMQATGVVLGFVVVAGAFLGLADLVSSNLMNLILK